MRINRLTALLASCLVVALAVSHASADDADNMFPFVIEKGAPDNITNVRSWDGANLEKAGAAGFVVDQNGAFFTSSGKTRLLGTNTCFGASFCSHEKADRLAETLSRFGIGVVRLHHMDSRDIWGKNYEKGSTEIDPDQLEKLDYLVSRLEERGIYININLHVSRAFREIDGFENTDKLPGHNKGVDNFDRRMIELQKKYAKDLLTHVNPYTGKAYCDDPGVAVVEINNENSVVASWSWGELDDLPEPYASDFQRLWNEWLSRKYGSTSELRAAWNCRSYPLGAELVADGVFAEDFAFNGSSKWTLELDGKSQCQWKRLAPERTKLGSSALRVEIDKLGEVAWRPQFHRTGLKVEAGKAYQLTFKARSDKDFSFSVGLKEDHDPWSAVGITEKVAVGDEWKEFQYAFVSTVTDDKIRISFSGFHDGDVVELADVSFREGGDVGLAPSLQLEKGEIPALKGKSANLATLESLADFTEFLHELEDSYWQEMYDYVKGLGVKSLVSGTQLQYGFWYNQGKLDYCDIHAYWNHPTFPNRPWDQNDWFVTNTCLANSPANGTLANLAAVRVVGRPFTCSEYDHPYPNFYAAEGNVMLAAVAAFQDWDATFQFAWSHGDQFERDAVSSFFDMCSNQTKMAHLPACYGIFTRGDVKAGPGQFVYAPSFTEQEEIDVMKGLLTSYHRALARGFKIDPAMSLAVFSGVELSDLELQESAALASAKRVKDWSELPSTLGGPAQKEIVNEFGEIKWNYQQEGRGRFVVDTARSKVFSGFVTEPCQFDAVKLDIGQTRLGWATVSLVKAKNLTADDAKNGKLSSGAYLLTATGDMRNTDAIFKETNGNAVTTAGAYGGSNGKAPVLCEGIPATITLAGVSGDSVEVYALDSAGARAKKLEVGDENGSAVFSIGPACQTLWYEVVVK